MYKLKKEELKVGMEVVLKGEVYLIKELTPIFEGCTVLLENEKGWSEVVTCVAKYYSSVPLFPSMESYKEYMEALVICDRVFYQFDFGRIPAGMSYDQVKRIEEILNEERNCD